MNIHCLGDSITQGWGLPDPEQQSFPGLLQEKYPDQSFRNFGSPGAMVQNFGYAYRDTGPYRQAIKQPADLSLLLLGSNDALAYTPGFPETYEKLLDSIEGPVVLITPPKLGFSRNALPQIRQDILDIAQKRNLPVIDLYSASSPAWLSSDQVHPSAYGQQEIAKVIEEGLRPYLKEK